ncbi:hypothetical protein [Listeria seeligeri]|uniref:hypothetical protein n=1 Tax=Listeria seeligeri TaxID=1640 RepID=UPI0021AB105F|nr:hypothetical protein [Listeria seeligeri]
MLFRNQFAQEKEIETDAIFIDGTKIEAATSTEIRKELRSKRKFPKQALKQSQFFLIHK